MERHDAKPDYLDRARAGDEVALTVLLTRSRRRVHAFVARRIPADLARVIDADDILQMAHVEAYRGIDSFEPRGADSFERWLSTIAIRKLRDAIKAHRARKRGGGRALIPLNGAIPEDSVIGLIEMLAGPERTPSRVVARGEAVAAMQRAMQSLPEHYRQAIWLVHIDGRPVAKAAELMGRTERAIHGLTRRGMELLRENLGDPAAYLSSSG